MDNATSSKFYVTPEVPSWAYTLASIAIALIFCLGFVSNLTIIVLFVKTPKIRTPFNYLLMNLIFTEFLSTTYGLPIDFIASVHQGWKMGKEFCLTSGFILSTVGMVTIVSLAFLSSQRYMMISDAGRFTVSTYSASAKIILAIWAYSLPITIPPFFGFGSYVPETSGLTCAPDWWSTEHKAYQIYLLIIGFLGPLFVILYFSFKTISYLRNQSNSIQSESIKNKSKKRESKIMVLVIWMNIGFLASWMPYAMVMLGYIFTPPGTVHPMVTIIPLVAAKTSVLWNPILYIAMNRQFRGAFRRWLYPEIFNGNANVRLKKMGLVEFKENVPKDDENLGDEKKDALVVADVHEERVETVLMKDGFSIMSCPSTFEQTKEVSYQLGCQGRKSTSIHSIFAKFHGKKVPDML